MLRIRLERVIFFIGFYLFLIESGIINFYLWVNFRIFLEKKKILLGKLNIFFIFKKLWKFGVEIELEFDRFFSRFSKDYY